MHLIKYFLYLKYLLIFLETKIEEIINDALKIAKKNEISGKSVTPFVLEYIGKNTKGKSLISSMSMP